MADYSHPLRVECVRCGADLSNRYERCPYCSTICDECGYELDENGICWRCNEDES